MKRAPPCGTLLAAIEPPWDSTIERLIDRPTPRPFALVVKYGSNSRGRTSAGIPGPASSTVIDTWASAAAVAIRTTGGCDRMTARRLHRIEHQVHRHLAELHAIGVDRREVGIEVRHQQHAFVDRRRVQDPDDVHHDGVQIDRPHVERFLAHELTGAFDDVRGVAVGGGDVVDERRQVLARDPRVLEHALERLRVTERCGQRLGQFVSDRRHQLAHASTHVHVRELVQRPPRLDFQALAGCDVQVRDDGPACSTLQATEAQVRRSALAAAPPVALEGSLGFPPGEHRAQRVATRAISARSSGTRSSESRSHGSPGFAAVKGFAVPWAGRPLVVAVLDHAVAVEDGEVSERRRQDRAGARRDGCGAAGIP